MNSIGATGRPRLHPPIMRMALHAGPAILALAAGVGALASCASHEEQPPAAAGSVLGALGAACSASRDCMPAFACVRAQCRLRCSTSVDCGPGQACAQGHETPVCLDPEAPAPPATTTSSPPFPPPSAPLGTAIAAGDRHTCVARAGRVKCWGINDEGALGVGDLARRGDDPGEMGDALPFVALGTSVKVASLAAGVNTSCAMTSDGRVKCWGNRGGTGLGEPTNDRGDQPGEMGDALPYLDLGAGRTVLTLASDLDSSCAILDNHKVKCWGKNDWGQLGLPDLTLVHGDQPGEMGDALPYVDLGTGVLAKKIVAGLKTSCVITMDDRMKCWGAVRIVIDTNGLRTLSPMGDSLPYVDVGAGRTVRDMSEGKCLVLDDASIKCVYPYSSVAPLSPSLGTGLVPKRLARAASGYLGTLQECVQLTDDRVKCWQRLVPPTDGDAVPFVDFGVGRTVKDLVVGRYHVCAVLDDGGVKCFTSNNDYGQLGDGTKLPRAQPAAGDVVPYVDLGAP